MEDIMSRVRDIIVDQFSIDPDSITSDMRIEDIGADSLDLVEMVMTVEEEFGIEIQDEDIETLTTIGDLVEYISDRA